MRRRSRFNARTSNAVGAVYGCNEQTVGMSAEQRLIHHQENSGPVMADLKERIERQFADRSFQSQAGPIDYLNSRHCKYHSCRYLGS